MIVHTGKEMSSYTVTVGFQFIVSQLLSLNHNDSSYGERNVIIFDQRNKRTMDFGDKLLPRNLSCLSGLWCLTISMTVSGTSNGVLEISAAASTYSSSTLSLDRPVD
jgi:hypothetical protein